MIYLQQRERDNRKFYHFFFFSPAIFHNEHLPSGARLWPIGDAWEQGGNGLVVGTVQVHAVRIPFVGCHE
jgi:hypothetical protein